VKSVSVIEPVEFARAAKERLKKWAPDLSPCQLDKCEIYIRELLRFNKTLNLVSPGTALKIDAVHILDVIRAWALVEPKIPAGSVIHDFGTGNGLPGLLFAALAPDREFYLLDRDQRKLEFCKHVISELKLSNVSVRNMDILDLPSGSVNFAVSRAFASVLKSLSAGKLFSIGGRFFMMKGESWSQELLELPPAEFAIWKTDLTGQYDLPGSPAKFVVIQCTKIAD
jgi:16S rRNA (guanine527-N7)-methyltransferase